MDVSEEILIGEHTVADCLRAVENAAAHFCQEAATEGLYEGTVRAHKLQAARLFAVVSYIELDQLEKRLLRGEFYTDTSQIPTRRNPERTD
jgi:hypothetical protein